MPRQNHSPVTAKQRQAFVDALADGKSIIDAAKDAGHNRRSFYRLKAADIEFATEWARAYEEGTDRLEAEAERRAVEGVDDFKMAGDEIVPMRKYSDTLLIFLLKARRPEKFRDNVTLEHSGPNGGPLEVRSEHVAEAIDRFTSTVVSLAARGRESAPTLQELAAGSAEPPAGGAD